MRVLLVSFIADNQWTGMGRWSHRIAQGIRQRGHTVTLWFQEDFPRLRRSGRWAVILYPVALAARLWHCRFRFDVVVIHEPAGFWYGLLRRLSPSLPRMIAMCHNVESKHFQELARAASRGLADVSLGMRIRARLLRHWQSDGAIRMADHVVCLSSLDRTYLVEQLRCPPEK